MLHSYVALLLLQLTPTHTYIYKEEGEEKNGLRIIVQEKDEDAKSGGLSYADIKKKRVKAEVNYKRKIP